MSLPLDTPLTPHTAEDYARASRRRLRNTLLQGILLSLLVGCSFVAFEIDNLALPVVVLFLVVFPIVLWHYPRLTFYITFIATCLFELQLFNQSDSLTDRVPFFWNVNTVFEIYAHANPKAVPFSPFELFAMLAGFFSFVRGVYTGKMHLKTGTLFPFILLYITCVCASWLYGLVTGGDFKLSLMEVRAQLYFLLAYLMVVNTVTERKQVVALLWISAICIAIKGILYTFRRHVTMAGLPLPDQGVGSHEEAFFFNSFLILLLTLWLTGVHRKLQVFLWLLLPFVTFGNLATNRRAGTAAFVVVVPLLFLSAYISLPRRRTLSAFLGITLSVLGLIYYRIFQNSDSTIAQPARAIHSQFQPDQRDLESNQYRTAENANIMYNVKANPLGYGYGKRMVITVPMADISKIYAFWDLLPHNQILWIWMRVGWQGFTAFWIMIGAILMHCGSVLRRTDIYVEAKALALYCSLITVMLLLFGLFDLQLSNYRDMLYSGFCAGLAVVATQAGITRHDEVADAPVKPRKNRIPPKA